MDVLGGEWEPCIPFCFLLHTTLYVIYEFVYALLLWAMVNLSPVSFVLRF